MTEILLINNGWGQMTDENKLQNLICDPFLSTFEIFAFASLPQLREKTSKYVSCVMSRDIQNCQWNDISDERSPHCGLQAIFCYSLRIHCHYVAVSSEKSMAELSYSRYKCVSGVKKQTLQTQRVQLISEKDNSYNKGRLPKHFLPSYALTHFVVI